MKLLGSELPSGSVSWLPASARLNSPAGEVASWVSAARTTPKSARGSSSGGFPLQEAATA